MSYWIDSHSHLNDAVFRNEFDSYIDNCLQNNVGKILLICMNKEDLLYSLDMKKKYPFIDLAFGYHPEDAEKISEQDLEYLDEMMANENIIAVGEVGLDLYWDSSYSQKQQEIFIRQIEIANKYHKPLLIHSRSAAKLTYDILKANAKTKVMMHCFGESLEMMNEYLKLGYYISFTGVVTFKNSKQPKINAASVPLDRLMIETDCPYMTPVPFRGKQNESSYVRYTGEFIANLRNISIEELQTQLMKNYQDFFGEELCEK